jgi:hypothetical protein
LPIGGRISNVTWVTAPACGDSVALFTVRSDASEHIGANLHGQYELQERKTDMPSLFRFVFIAVALAGLFTAGMWVLATKYEPVQREEVKVVPGVKIRKE